MSAAIWARRRERSPLVRELYRWQRLYAKARERGQGEAELDNALAWAVHRHLTQEGNT